MAVEGQSHGQQTGGAAFAAFMAGPIGRIARVALGLVLILIGLLAMDGTAGLIVVVVGIAPLAAGIFNFCLIAPLVRAPFWGRDARA
jgi:hypothetical protein